MAKKSFHSALRARILALEPEQWLVLTKPCTIQYSEEWDGVVYYHPVTITMVGRYTSRGQAKLLSEFDQLFCLSEATEAECEAILAALPA